MRITLEGAAAKPSYLLVAENWYPDWHAKVDGRATPVHRADHTLLSVVLPAGAKEVTFTFASAAYSKGKLVTLLAVLVTVALLGASWWPGRRAVAHG
jgi:uncharacterized membrane protein YfhO